MLLGLAACLSLRPSGFVMQSQRGHCKPSGKPSAGRRCWYKPQVGKYMNLVKWTHGKIVTCIVWAVPTVHKHEQSQCAVMAYGALYVTFVWTHSGKLWYTSNINNCVWNENCAQWKYLVLRDVLVEIRGGENILCLQYAICVTVHEYMFGQFQQRGK